MPDQKSQMSSLREAASQINSGSDLARILHDLTRSACEHGNWSMGSIMAVDVAHGYAEVVSRHNPSLLPRPLEDRWELATSPALVALQRSEAVYIKDAREAAAFPGYRREAFERDYRSVLVLPMTSIDAQGRPMVLSLISQVVREVTEDDLAFMNVIVHLGAIAVEREHRHRAQQVAAEELRRALVAQGMLLHEVLSGGSSDALAAMLGDLLGQPVLIVDFSANAVLATASPSPGDYDDAAWKQAAGGALADQIIAAARGAVARDLRSAQVTRLEDGVRRLQLQSRIETLTVDGEAVGALMIFGEAGGSDLHKLLLESAKFALSVQMMRSVIRFRFETRTLTELFFEIVERRWRDAEDVAHRARRLGLQLSSATGMVVVDFPDMAERSRDVSSECHHAVLRLLRQQAVPGHVVAVGSGLVCLFARDTAAEQARIARIARRIAETLRHVFDREPIVVIGGACAGLEDYPVEWERCWRMIRIARAFGRSGALSAPDFGPLPMLIGAADAGEVRSFVEGSIGAIAVHDRANGTPYLETLAAYVRSGCRSQACADALELHVTTLRYRLQRITELFAIELDTPERRFAIELALQLHGLIENGPARPV